MFSGLIFAIFSALPAPGVLARIALFFAVEAAVYACSLAVHFKLARVRQALVPPPRVMGHARGVGAGSAEAETGWEDRGEGGGGGGEVLPEPSLSDAHAKCSTNTGASASTNTRLHDSFHDSLQIRHQDLLRELVDDAPPARHRERYICIYSYICRYMYM